MLHYWMEECLDFFFSSLFPIEVCSDTWLCFTFQPYMLPLKYFAVVRKQKQLEPRSKCCFLYWREGVVLASVFVMVYYFFNYTATATAKLLQSCRTLWDPIDDSPPGSSVPGILQARTLKWVAISFSTAWKWKVKVKSLSRIRLFATPWTAAYQDPPSMGFSRQEYWSGVPLPSLSTTLAVLKLFSLKIYFYAFIYVSYLC